MSTALRCLLIWLTIGAALAGEVPAEGLLHLSTDKPIYRPGETVYIRGFALTALMHRPLEGFRAVQISVVSPRGDALPASSAVVGAGALGLSWQVPLDAAGGTWRVVASGSPSLPPAERSFAVQTLYEPTLVNELSFRRDSYGPGDEIVADLTVRQASGGSAAGTPVTIIARIGEQEIHRSQARVDDSGRVLAQVRLPQQLASGDATLSCVVGPAGASETASRPIPLAVRPPDLRLYPEGGDLVAGLPTRVYAEAFLANGHPAAFAGEIVDDLGAVVATITSAHEGRCRCVLTPKAGRNYRLILREPVAASYPLSSVQSAGGVICALDAATAPDAALRLMVAASGSGGYQVVICKRSTVLTTFPVDLKAGEPRIISVPLSTEIDGTLAATLLGPNDTLLAERLVFRQPRESLTLTITTDRVDYLPDGSVAITVTTRNAAGKPVAALVGLTVSDDALRSRVPRRERAPRLPAMVLLEGDVRELADADAYLDPRDPQSAAALDLLLGTQGWRRFAHQHPAAFLSGFGQAARRALGWGSGAESPAAGGPRSSIPGRIQALGVIEIPNTPSAGREEAVSTSEMGNTGAFMAIGAGGGSAGMFGSRTGGGRRRALAVNGGNRASESAVDSALRFFKRHQNADGSWSLTGYPERCTEMPRCEPGPRWQNGDGDVAATALAALSFVGAGYDQLTPNKYRTTISIALTWLVAQQRADGSLATGTWSHALATQVLAEAFAMTNDPKLKQPAQQAVHALLSRWQKDNALGWTDTLSDGTPCPTLASLAAAGALKSALSGGLNIGDSLEKTKFIIPIVWTRANPGIAAWTDEARLACRFPARWDPAAAIDGPQQLAAGALLARMHGFPEDGDLRQALDAATLVRESPGRRPWRLLSVQTGAFALVKRGDARWQTWNTLMRDPLVDAQRRGDACFDGSWDPDGDPDAPNGGRLFCTAHACRALQSYYAYRIATNDERALRASIPPSPITELYEFAHRPPNRIDADVQPPDTVYWHRGLRTTADTGSETVRFTCARKPAVLRVVVDAVSSDGVLASSESTMAVVPAVTLAMRLPATATVGDRILAPVTIHQHSGNLIATVVTSLTSGGVTVGKKPDLTKTADGVVTDILPVVATIAGAASVELYAQIGDQPQRVTGRIAVRAAGFPWTHDQAGSIDRDAEHTLTITVPADVVDGQATATLRLYADPAVNAIQAASRLQVEPTGCFEQTTSKLYPMLMAQRLLLQRADAPLGLLRSGQELIALGADRLRTFRCPDGGFGWWGGTGDPVLTAYGLMILADLRAVGRDDPTLFAQCRAWLLKQRDGRGRFIHARSGGRTADAYVLWALLESAGDDRQTLTTELARELDALTANALASTNAYEIALAANVLALAERTKPAAAVRGRLVQAENGSVIGATASAIGSGGDSLEIETTALASLAWSRANAQTQTLEASRFLRSRCQDGRFGNTQATVLALRALMTEESARDTKASTVVMTIAGQAPQIARIDPTRRQAQDPLTVTLPPGTHTITITQHDGGRLPWSLHVAGHVTRPQSDPACALRLDTRLSRTRVPAGEPLECIATLTNASAAEVRSPLVIVPLPGGVEPDPEHLRGLVRAKRIAASEVIDGAVVLYFDQLAANEVRSIPLALIATVPGSYGAPAARAYAYYTDERKWWCEPLKIEIEAKN